MSKPSSALIEHIYRMAGIYTDNTSSDAELITRYAEMRDERAFSTLMVRHGLMVWNICQRILHDTQDAEEAYQTTFLSLAHKAKKIRGETLVAWLHHVAQQTAAAFRRKARSRDELQKSAQFLRRGDSTSESNDDEIYGRLHSEIAKLPERVRLAVVLHYLEGKTQAEVASILGVDESAVWQRVSRGKSILEKRLNQQGFAMAAAALSSLLAESASNAAMPPGLINKTVAAATVFCDGKLRSGSAKLAQEALKHTAAAAPWWKTGWTITILCVGGLGVAGGGIAWKAGLFDTKAEAPAVASKPDLPAPIKKKSPKPARLDAYGDPLPPGALARLGTMRLRHVDVSSICFVPDGKRLITAGGFNPPCLWDISSGKLLRQFGEHSLGEIRAVALSRDGRLLAGKYQKSLAGQTTGGLLVWETATGKLIREFQDDSPDALNPNFAFTADGKAIAASLNGCLGLWEIATGRPVWEEFAVGDIHHVAVAFNGKTIAAANGDATRPRGERITLRDGRTGKKLREVLPDVPAVQSLEFSPNGETLLINHYTKTVIAVKAVDVGTGRLLWTVLDKSTGGGPLPTLCAVKCSPDGKLIATHGATFGIRDAATGKLLREREGRWDGWGCMAFSPDGKFVATAGRMNGQMVAFWEVESGKELPMPQLHAHEQAITSACFLSNGKTLASAGKDGAIHLWDVHTGREQPMTKTAITIRPFAGFWPHAQIASSSDNRILAACFLDTPNEGPNYIARRRKASTHLWLWDAATGKKLHSIKADGMLEVAHMVFSPDGKLLLAQAGADVQCWDTASGKRLDNKDFPGRNPAFHPDGTMVATIADAGRDQSLTFWDVATDKERGSIACGPGQISDMAISPDGRMAVVCINGKITLFPLHKDARGAKIRFGAGRPIHCAPSTGYPNVYLCFSPDSRLLGFSTTRTNGESGAIVCELASGEERAHFSGHASSVTTLCFAPDGRSLVTGSCDTTLLIWDATGRRQEDGSLRPASSTKSNLENLWLRLGKDDAVAAGRAIWELVALGGPAASFLETYLHPAAKVPLTLEIVEQYIADLDADNFKIRKKARDALTKLGDRSKPALRRALANSPSEEKRHTIQQLLAVLEARGDGPSTPMLRALRAVEVLEQMGSREARQLLQKLAAGAEEASLTEESQAALSRINAMDRRRQKRNTLATYFYP